MPRVTRPPKQRSASYSAPALEKGLEIIELLAASPEPLSTRAIAERLGRSKNEIFRMVFVLIDRGYLSRDPASDALTLTNRLFDLGIRTPRSRQLIEVAAPAMERLSERIGLSTHLIVVNRGDTVVIATAAGSADISFSLRLGYRRPALDATSGLTVIAFQDTGKRAQMIEESAASARRVPTVKTILKRLDAIRENGYLVAKSQDVVGVTDICAPVLDEHGHAIASIVVPYLERHGVAPRHDRIVTTLLETCRSISLAPEGLPEAG